MERRSQFQPQPQVKGLTDIGDLIGAALTGQPCPQKDITSRLLFAMSLTHLPNYITTGSMYGKHADYPSPRSYYQLQSILCRKGEKGWCHQHIDLEDWTLRELDTQLLSLPEPTADISLVVQTNFNIYNPLYNRFRFGLFCLELGHCFRALSRNLHKLGLAASLDFVQETFVIDIFESDERQEASSLDMTRRTSGFFDFGLFPARAEPELMELPDIAACMADYLTLFPRQYPEDFRALPGIKALVDNHPSYPSGIYQWHAGEFVLEKPGSFMADFEEAYNYNNFSFIHSSIVLFFTIDPAALSDNRATALCNAMLGAFSQRVIEHFTAKGLFARPFRSYDQFKLDSLLHGQQASCMTYYGLLVGKNRAALPLGAIK